jgi:hypothetical protein
VTEKTPPDATLERADEEAPDARDLLEAEAPLELSEWPVEAPPDDFAARVLARLDEATAPRAETAEPPPPAAALAPVVEVTPKAAGRSRRAALILWSGVAVAIAAALLFRFMRPRDLHGEIVATARSEVTISGGRAIAVLEPGARVVWDGDQVTQSRGDVFYRVEQAPANGHLHVRTPAGEVDAQGACLTVKVRGGEAAATATDGEEAMQKRDWKVGSVGALAGALVFVGVHEGRVAVSRASERVELSAGESASLGPDGATKGALGESERAFEAKAASASATDEPFAKANENLVAQVSDYRGRLEALAMQKSALEAKLAATETRLASLSDGAAPRTRSEWDLDKDDWTALAKKGEVKYRLPCSARAMKPLSPERLSKLGLAPTDTPVLREAFDRANRATWEKIKPLCVQALGASPEIVEKIGVESCPHLIYDLAMASDGDATREAHTRAAEVRAGLRPEPGPGERVHPVTQMFLALTAATGVVESELAKTYGPDDAHRLAYADDICASSSRWGGGKKREAGDR